jgi:hypothetical protein
MIDRTSFRMIADLIGDEWLNDKMADCDVYK